MPLPLFRRGIRVRPPVVIAEHQLVTTPAELNELHGQGAVAADFAKLHAITKTAEQINGMANNATANPQQAHIDDAGEGTEVATINAILAALEAAGILAGE